MIGTWGVDIEESNNFILIYIVIFAMTYAVTNVSYPYEIIGEITGHDQSRDFIIFFASLHFVYYRHSSWFMNWL